MTNPSLCNDKLVSHWAAHSGLPPAMINYPTSSKALGPPPALQVMVVVVGPLRTSQKFTIPQYGHKRLYLQASTTPSYPYIPRQVPNIRILGQQNCIGSEYLALKILVIALYPACVEGERWPCIHCFHMHGHFFYTSVKTKVKVTKNVAW